MLINEVSKRTKTTKKAIAYYTLQGLLSPAVLENGYRDYDEQDVEKLNQINALRKLDISVEEIRSILDDATNRTLQKVSVRKELSCQRDLLKSAVLKKLSQGIPYDKISAELQAIEQSKTITDKLLDAFPGYYGRFICMHFARFLNEPIRTKAQQTAYETILLFLDEFPDLVLPKDLEEYLMENTKSIGTEQISEMLEALKMAYEDPDDFLSENKEVLEQYMEYKKSVEYKNSPAFRLMELMAEFNNSSGYNDVFIPAMKQLSPAYAEYHLQIEAADKKLLERYPEMERLSSGYPAKTADRAENTEVS